jgi:hypothetical protein
VAWPIAAALTARRIAYRCRYRGAPQPALAPPVAEWTARVAFSKGDPYLRLRDKLGSIFSGADFAKLYPKGGQPARPSWKLALVTVMQFAEDLSDLQAADAVRGRNDGESALGLELDDLGYQATRLPKGQEARYAHAELIGADGYRLLDALRRDAAAAWLWRIPAVEVLRRGWLSRFSIEGDRGRWRTERPVRRPGSGSTRPTTRR